MVSNWRALVQGKLDLVTVDMRHNRMFDDVHPNAQGHALIADTVYAQIKGDLL